MLDDRLHTDTAGTSSDLDDCLVPSERWCGRSEMVGSECWTPHQMLRRTSQQDANLEGVALGEMHVRRHAFGVTLWGTFQTGCRD